MEVTLSLDPDRDTFTGSVTVELQVLNPVDHFWLNATELTVGKAQIEQNSASVAAQIIPGGEDFIGFAVDKPLKTGPARITLAYSGKVNQKSSAGIFRSERDKDRYLFTQFEPLDARRAFPCFDEPGFKIPWRLTLRVPSNVVAVSNTNVESETREAEGTKLVRFRETKPLPSYLIAFGVGPLEFVDGGKAGSRQIPVRIIVPRGDKERAKYAASISAEILTRLENYFGIPYPYDKSDQLAIPLSFGGAMENPGLVTYDSTIVLSPPGADTLTRQRRYAEIAAHELAHQWFGDMVTMSWWNDVWLNESFATWMSAKLIADWKPEWETRTEDQSARLSAVAADTNASARRINQPAESKSDVGNAFDSITYQKGGSVLAMFENAIGPDRFKQAVHNYLTAHLFGNARAEDFLSAIGQSSSPEYSDAFSTFLNQNGVPQIKLDLRCNDHADAEIQLDQMRLSPVGSSADAAAVWSIPVCFSYSYGKGRQQMCQLLKTRNTSVKLKRQGCPTWVLGNSGQLGYYETVYPANLLAQLVTHRHELT
jgi:alanyl aminopeptidase